MRVQLTPSEVAHAAGVGVRRRIVSMNRNQPQKLNVENAKYYDLDIEAACAELAFAKATGVYWPGSVNPGKDEADLYIDGDPYEVRHTTYENGKLIIRPGDILDRMYVLVTGRSGEYEIVGKMWGRMVEHLPKEGDPPAWFIGRHLLQKYE